MIRTATAALTLFSRCFGCSTANRTVLSGWHFLHKIWIESLRKHVNFTHVCGDDREEEPD